MMVADYKLNDKDEICEVVILSEYRGDPSVTIKDMESYRRVQLRKVNALEWMDTERLSVLKDHQKAFLMKTDGIWKSPAIPGGWENLEDGKIALVKALKEHYYEMLRSLGEVF